MDSMRCPNTGAHLGGVLCEAPFFNATLPRRDGLELRPSSIASYLAAMTSNLEAMASNPNLIAMASNLV